MISLQLQLGNNERKCSQCSLKQQLHLKSSTSNSDNSSSNNINNNNSSNNNLSNLTMTPYRSLPFNNSPLNDLILFTRKSDLI